MAKVYYEKDGDLKDLAGKTVAIIGYGSQGHAHALNLRDSGVKVIVAERMGDPPRTKARDAGFEVYDASEAARRGDLIVILIPDPIQAKIYQESVAPHLGPGKTLVFAHGFNIHYKFIVPPPTVDVIMIAPKCPGHRLRELFTEGIGVPSLLAIEQDASGHAEATGLAYAKGIGSLKAGVIRTTFKEETETDLFGEQIVLCGGVSALITNAFETLVEAGYQPEMAYFECLHELKLICDLMYESGIAGMRFSVSETAKYGDITRGPRIVNAATKREMRRILKEIQTGKFTREWVAEYKGGLKKYKRLLKKGAAHRIERTGERLRGMMPWMTKKNLKGVQAAY